jgi:glucose-1-phosphate thymidylyltransferase
MIGIILAGGYAKRLWPLTLDRPKPLLPLRGRVIIDYALDTIAFSNSIIRKVIVLTSSSFQPQFEEWAQAKGRHEIEILSDGSLSEEDKPGAVGALASISPHINEDFLVIAGDCIYPTDAKGLLQCFRKRNAPVVGIYHARNIDQVKRGSAVMLDSDNTIVSFVEKPENPTTDLVGAVIYAFPSRMTDRLKEYFELGLARDEPGRFIEWLHKRENVYGYVLRNCLWDIGTPESYRAAEEHFSREADCRARSCSRSRGKLASLREITWRDDAS